MSAHFLFCRLPRFKHSLFAVIVSCLMLGSSFTHAAMKIDIAIVSDGPWARGAEFLTLQKNEIRDLLGKEFQVRFHEGKQYQGRWTLSSVDSAIAAALNAKDIEIVIASGVLSSQSAINWANRKRLPKPVIAPFVIDAKLQNLPRNGKTSGKHNLSYLDPITSLDRDFLAFREVTDFKHLAMVVDRLVVKSMPGLDKRVVAAAKAFDIKIDLVPADNKAKLLLKQIPSSADAVMVVPLLRFSESEIDQLAQGLIARKLPSFSVLGRNEVEQGLLASASPAADYNRVARRVALNIQQILLGRNAAELDVSFPNQFELAINMQTARAIKVWPRWSVLAEATLLHDNKPKPARNLSLASTMQEASRRNIDLLAEAYSVAANAEDVRIARGKLLPQLTASTTYGRIDRDRAVFARGQQAERFWDISLVLQQQLYHNELWAQFRIEQHSHRVREYEYDALKLDIAQAAANAYLNVLRAEALENIEQDNLRLTQANLQRAELRESIGISGLADVYRWDSAVASNRQAVLDAGAQAELARIELNRLLHLAPETYVALRDADTSDQALLLSDPRMTKYIDNPWAYATFRDFMVSEGLQRGPEIAALSAAIEAAKTAARAAMRELYTPDVVSEARLTHELSSSGAGQDLPPGADLDDTEWQVGITASIPLFAGGSRVAIKRQTQEQLEQLRLERSAVQERVEQRIRSALHLAGASYAGINLSAQAAAAAEANLEIVSDGYGRGVVSVIDLLDAQNATLVSDQAAANARYDFLIDMLEVQRAVGQYDYFLSAEQREQYFQRLEAYFAKVGQ